MFRKPIVATTVDQGRMGFSFGKSGEQFLPLRSQLVVLLLKLGESLFGDGFLDGQGVGVKARCCGWIRARRVGSDQPVAYMGKLSYGRNRFRCRKCLLAMNGKVAEFLNRAALVEHGLANRVAGRGLMDEALRSSR